MTSEPTAPMVLVTDTDDQRARAIARALTDAGFRVSTALDSLDALIAAEMVRPTLVVLNWSMPFINGAIVLQVLLRELNPPPRVIAIVFSEDDALRASQAGAAACLHPPLTAEQVRGLARSLLSAPRT